MKRTQFHENLERKKKDGTLAALRHQRSNKPALLHNVLNAARSPQSNLCNLVHYVCVSA